MLFDLEQKHIKNEAFVKAGDLISLFAFYYCSNWSEFCEEHAELVADREDLLVDQDKFESNQASVISKYFENTETHSHVPLIMQIKKGNPCLSDLSSIKRQKEFLDSFDAFKFFPNPDESGTLKKILDLLNRTKLKKNTSAVLFWPFGPHF